VNKIKVLFVCYGNICRSPMAEFMFKKLVQDEKLEDYFEIESAATSTEELGNSVHYETVKLLNLYGIDCSKKRARQVKEEDLFYFDYIVAMDNRNVQDLKRMFKVSSNQFRKIFRLLDLTDFSRDISDPWYSGNFNQTWSDLDGSLPLLLKKIKNDHLDIFKVVKEFNRLFP